MAGTACGKVILLGEHAVVYGVPALAVGIHRGARAVVTMLPGGPSELVLADAAGATDAVRVTDAEAGDLARAFAALLTSTATRDPVRVSVVVDLPTSAGLGSSAAIGVAVTRALDELGGRGGASTADVVDRAMAWERVFHGNPSGIDVAVAARGGCLLFQRKEGFATMEPVALGSSLALAVGHTGVTSSTRTMVDAVARLRDRKPEVVDKAFSGIASLVGNARLAIEAGDLAALGHLMDLNQMLLSGLMLSIEETETLCRLARGAGALGAKLTGSGGGGCVVALAGDAGDRILEAWRSAGFSGFLTTVEPARISPKMAVEAP